MTQILAALTHEYVLVASDRQLTFVSGPRKGVVADDNACKLVCLCGIWGIAYTGFAQMQGLPTHEWIAVRLAENACRNPIQAAQILADAATVAVRAAAFPLELTFLIAGWARLSDLKTLQPHFLLISNMLGRDGKTRESPGPDLNCFERRLKKDEVYASSVIGHPLQAGRGKYLDRFMRRLLKHKVGPKPAMQAFANEIVRTSRPGGTVGKKILAFSIPKVAAERTYQTGDYALLAAEPDLYNVAFCYFDPAYSHLHQYGPTSVCGQSYVTDLETESDPTRDFQCSSGRLFHLPKRQP